MPELAVLRGPVDSTAKARLSPDRLRELSQVSSARGLLAVGTEWAAIALAIWVALAVGHWGVTLAAIVWIGARMHALGVLMHEATHYRLVRQRWLNDWIGDVCLAWPLFVTLGGYRSNHLAHHRHLNAPEDPDWARKQGADWQVPRAPRALLGTFVRDLLGLNTLRHLRGVQDFAAPRGNTQVRAPRARLRIAVYLSGAAVLTVTGAWSAFLLLWVVPCLTWFQAVLRLRSLAEHFPLQAGSPLVASRTTYVGPFASLLLLPRGVGYHLDHHLYPSVPCYRLPDLHRALLADPGFRDQARINPSLWSVVRDCVTTPGDYSGDAQCELPA